MVQPRRDGCAWSRSLKQTALLCQRGSPSALKPITKQPDFCTGGNSVPFLHCKQVLLAEHDETEIDAYAAQDLTEYQAHAQLSAFYLATCATTMRSTRKEASTAASSSSKASPVAHKRKRKPGEARFYAVRAGRIPGVYTTWDECQQMINGFAGAQCKYLKLAPPTETKQYSIRPGCGTHI